MLLKVVLWIFITIIAANFSCGEKEPAQKKFPKIYNEKADAKADIEAAIAEAANTKKHVLLMFGANWCPWCQSLHQLFQENTEVKKTLEENFVLVMVDVGYRDKNLDLDEKYGNPIKLGLPVLVVLDETGRHIHTQETGSLELTGTDKKAHDPQKVIQFLQKWGASTCKNSI